MSRNALTAATPFRSEDQAPGNHAKSVALLNEVLAHTLDLGLQARQDHWNVTGPNFVAVHEMLGRLVDDLDADSDLVAERIAQLGGVAEATTRAIEERSVLNAYPRAIGGQEYLWFLVDAIARVASLTGRVLHELSALADPVSVDILTEVLRGLEKWLWYADSHLDDKHRLRRTARV